MGRCSRLLGTCFGFAAVTSILVGPSISIGADATPVPLIDAEQTVVEFPSIQATASNTITIPTPAPSTEESVPPFMQPTAIATVAPVSNWDVEQGTYVFLLTELNQILAQTSLAQNCPVCLSDELEIKDIDLSPDSAFDGFDPNFWGDEPTMLTSETSLYQQLKDGPEEKAEKVCAGCVWHGENCDAATTREQCHSQAPEIGTLCEWKTLASGEEKCTSRTESSCNRFCQRIAEQNGNDPKKYQCLIDKSSGENPLEDMRAKLRKIEGCTKYRVYESRHGDDTPRVVNGARVFLKCGVPVLIEIHACSDGAFNKKKIVETFLALQTELAKFPAGCEKPQIRVVANQCNSWIDSDQDYWNGAPIEYVLEDGLVKVCLKSCKDLKSCPLGAVSTYAWCRRDNGNEAESYSSCMMCRIPKGEKEPSYDYRDRDQCTKSLYPVPVELDSKGCFLLQGNKYECTGKLRCYSDKELYQMEDPDFWPNPPEVIFAIDEASAKEQLERTTRVKATAACKMKFPDEPKAEGIVNELTCKKVQ